MKREDAQKLENWLKTLKMANDALRKGFGPAHNSDKLYVAIPGICEYDGFFGTDVYYAVVVQKDENGARPVDWYTTAFNSKRDFLSGFGGWHNEDYDTFIKDNPWVKEVWDSLDKDIKAVFEKKGKIYEEDDKVSN